MELMDEFAARAMQGILGATTTMHNGIPMNDLAKLAYDNAEAMMKERESRKKNKGWGDDSQNTSDVYYTLASKAGLKAGDKVTFVGIGSGGDHKKGIVKSLGSQEGCVFVVYNCNNDWESYWDYTAASTRLKDLKLGWD